GYVRANTVSARAVKYRTPVAPPTGDAFSRRRSGGSTVRPLLPLAPHCNSVKDFNTQNMEGCDSSRRDMRY
ncbi:MAG TPA: hypothetical protein PLR25_17080, partial [Planctomycetaceae bacterium]|nr:hypothetical protein [Planctomycetaceae bacterium]